MAPFRVLAVDDEKDILDSLAQLLPMLVEDVDVTCASSGAAGLERLAATDFDLLISDYKMPKMDGLEFIRRAQKRAPALKTVLMTAYPDARLAAEARRSAGLVAFLPKPFDLDDLVRIIHDNMT